MMFLTVVAVVLVCLATFNNDHVAADVRGGQQNIPRATRNDSRPRSNASEDRSWEMYKTRFRKNYSCIEDESRRRSIWRNCTLTIKYHNEQALSGKHTFTLRENRLLDLTPQEYAKMQGYRRPSGKQGRRPRRATTPMYKQTVSVDQLPTCVNWTENGWVGPIKWQGKCGSCWAHSAVGAIEAQFYNQSGRFVQLSPQNLLDCTQPLGNHGCDGGHMQIAYSFVKTNGIESLLTYPDTASVTGEAAKSCMMDASRRVTHLDGWQNVDWDNELALQQAVALVGPVAAAVDSDSFTFQTYGGGIYRSSTCGSSIDAVDHAVLVVGYGVYNNQPYWLIQNTWGPSWGINGYMMLARNENNMCGIAADASFPIIGTNPARNVVRSTSSCLSSAAAAAASQGSLSAVSVWTSSYRRQFFSVSVAAFVVALFPYGICLFFLS